jgi:hypothetical protein
MLRTIERRPTIRTLHGWAISVLKEAGAICECEEHGWMRDCCDPCARERAFDVAREYPPDGISARTLRSPSRSYSIRSATLVRSARSRMDDRHRKRDPSRAELAPESEDQFESFTCGRRGFADDTRDAARPGGSFRSQSARRASSFASYRSNQTEWSSPAERPRDRSFHSDTRRTCKPPLYVTIERRPAWLVTWKQQQPPKGAASGIIGT